MEHVDKSAVIISQICSRTAPGKKMLQKLMYLIDRRGVSLGLNFGIHFFGPYSSLLENKVHNLERNDSLVVDTRGQTHTIRLGDIPIKGSLDPTDQQAVDFVMDAFLGKTAFELEAITTLDYVAKEMLKDYSDRNKIIAKVKSIKGDKFSSKMLNSSIDLLLKYGYDRM